MQENNSWKCQADETREIDYIDKKNGTVVHVMIDGIYQDILIADEIRRILMRQLRT